MKTHHIIIAIVSTCFVLIIGVPQIMGKIYVNNLNEKKPIDWLSAFFLKFYEAPKESEFFIPEDIKTIIIKGSEKFNYYNHIFINDTSTNKITYNQLDHISVTQKTDTLYIEFEKGAIGSNLKINLDSAIYNIGIKNIKYNNLYISGKTPINLFVLGNSSVNLHSTHYRNMENIVVSEQSVLTFNDYYAHTANVQIDNSMVYVNYNNRIDSLYANLVGKSNIKKINESRNQDKDLETLKKDYGIDNYAVNIIASGNLQYYKEK